MRATAAHAWPAQDMAGAGLGAGALGIGGCFLNQRSDQPQQLLLLRALPASAEKGSDFDIRNLAA